MTDDVTRARLRASDRERDEAIHALSEHFAAGRLDQQEFTTRMERAQQATYRDDLGPLFADLPASVSPAGLAAPDPGVRSIQRTRPSRQTRPPWPLWLPLVVLAVVAATGIAAWHGRFPFWPLVLVAFLLARLLRRAPVHARARRRW